MDLRSHREMLQDIRIDACIYGLDEESNIYIARTDVQMFQGKLYKPIKTYYLDKDLEQIKEYVEVMKIKDVFKEVLTKKIDVKL